MIVPYVESSSTHPFEIGFFIQDYILRHIQVLSVMCSFLLLDNIQFGCNHSLSIHPLNTFG